MDNGTGTVVVEGEGDGVGGVSNFGNFNLEIHERRRKNIAGTDTPSVEEQLVASKKRLRLQEAEIAEVMEKRKPVQTLLDFMSIERK